MMYFLLMSRKTSFFKLNDIFPECSLYTKEHPRIEPAMCLRETSACTVGHNCMETLVKRVKVLFEEVLDGVELLILYFKKRNTPGMGAVVLWRDFREPRVITVNPGAWKKIKERGWVYQFTPGSSFFLSGQTSDATPTSSQNTSLL